jgi:hypothetical protein
MGSLATGIIMLNDSFLHDKYEERYTEPDPEVFDCDSGSDKDSNDDNCDSDSSDYSEGFYGDEVLGGRNGICSLSNATSLELIADVGEVYM